MFFGLTNAPATFQLMMDNLFQDLINKEKVIVYLDDILIFSSTIEEHQTLVPLVLQILQKAKLTCKPEKCQFETQQTPVSATSIYLTALVITNAVFISSMLIVLPSNIWCALALMEGDIRARRRPNIWVADPIFDLIKTRHDQGSNPAPRIKITRSGVLPPGL